MKKILALLLACVMLCMAFASCESKGDGESTCDHEGATLGWVITNNSHRRVYTCCGAIKSEGVHELDDNGKCIVCGISNFDDAEIATDGDGSNNSEESDHYHEEEPEEPLELPEGLVATHYATIEIEKYGTIKLELYGEVAPITVENFVKLANDGFYDGLTFHRVVSDFMIQGGSPDGDSLGGNKDADGNEITIKGEFELNGHKNNIPHARGVISMARAGYSYDSASSQFFIVQSDSAHLDGAYAAFGYVIEGLDVVDDICEKVVPTDDFGTVPAENQPKIKSIRVEAAK